MKIGYARTSTFEQAAGCEKVFQEQLSSIAKCRPALEAAIEFVREGDELYVTICGRCAPRSPPGVGIAPTVALGVMRGRQRVMAKLFR